MKFSNSNFLKYEIILDSYIDSLTETINKFIVTETDSTSGIEIIDDFKQYNNDIPFLSASTMSRFASFSNHLAYLTYLLDKLFIPVAKILYDFLSELDKKRLLESSSQDNLEDLFNSYLNTSPKSFAVILNEASKEIHLCTGLLDRFYTYGLIAYYKNINTPDAKRYFSLRFDYTLELVVAFKYFLVTVNFKSIKRDLTNAFYNANKEESSFKRLASISSSILSHFTVDTPSGHYNGLELPGMYISKCNVLDTITNNFFKIKTHKLAIDYWSNCFILELLNISNEVYNAIKHPSNLNGTSLSYIIVYTAIIHTVLDTGNDISPGQISNFVYISDKISDELSRYSFSDIKNSINELSKNSFGAFRGSDLKYSSLNAILDKYKDLFNYNDSEKVYNKIIANLLLFFNNDANAKAIKKLDSNEQYKRLFSIISDILRNDYNSKAGFKYRINLREPSDSFKNKAASIYLPDNSSYTSLNYIESNPALNVINYKDSIKKHLTDSFNFSLINSNNSIYINMSANITSNQDYVNEHIACSIDLSCFQLIKNNLVRDIIFSYFMPYLKKNHSLLVFNPKTFSITLDSHAISWNDKCTPADLLYRDSSENINSIKAKLVNEKASSEDIIELYGVFTGYAGIAKTLKIINKIFKEFLTYLLSETDETLLTIAMEDLEIYNDELFDKLKQELTFVLNNIESCINEDIKNASNIIKSKFPEAKKGILMFNKGITPIYPIY